MLQARSESPHGKSLPRKEGGNVSPKLTRSKRIHEYEKIDKVINGFEIQSNVSRLWQNESILRKYSPNVNVVVNDYASSERFVCIVIAYFMCYFVFFVKQLSQINATTSYP